MRPLIQDGDRILVVLPTAITWSIRLYVFEWLRERKKIEKFQENFVATGDISLGGKTFQELVLQINQNEPSEAFAKAYIADAEAFLNLAKAFREEAVAV